MAILRNMTKRMVAFDCAALGTAAHKVGVADRDATSGAKGLRVHKRDLPMSLTLAASGNPKAPLAQALADGSAVAGLPDEVLSDPSVVALRESGTLWAASEAKPAASTKPADPPLASTIPTHSPTE